VVQLFQGTHCTKEEIFFGFSMRKSYLILRVDLPDVKIKMKGNPYNVACYLLETCASSAGMF
jgi:hypothetical protein